MNTTLANPAPVPAPRIGSASATGHYTGDELKPFEGRPGSQDNLRIPSLMGTQRIYRRDAP